MELSHDQVTAIEKVIDWWTNDTTPHFTLAGYAGTGKTTVISRMIKDFKGRVVVGAPTGKAAFRLREKGVRASTIHMLAYKFHGYAENGELDFSFEGLPANSLIIIDEASMIDKRIYNDLLQGGYRILFVGDHGQLAPVGEDPGLMAHPDFTLSVIHRQDDDGLLRFAKDLRDGIGVPLSAGTAETIWLDPNRVEGIARGGLAWADVTICWKNSTRHWLNHLAMQGECLSEDLAYDPTSADDVLVALVGHTIPVVCLRNNYKLGIFNGQVFEAEINTIGNHDVRLTLTMPDGSEQAVLAEKIAFRAQSRLKHPMTPSHTFFDFGHCLTAHKSQGSDWNKVCVFDDTNSYMDDRARWAYTAATRAKKELRWLHR